MSASDVFPLSAILHAQYWMSREILFYPASVSPVSRVCPSILDKTWGYCKCNYQQAYWCETSDILPAMSLYATHPLIDFLNAAGLYPP